MPPDADRTLHLHLAAFAVANALVVGAWAASGATGGSGPFWLMVLWGSALALLVARSDDGPTG
jgi:hypothetical protein